MSNLLKAAAVLDAAANHFDALEGEKVSALTIERQTQIDALASKYAEAVGEEMPANVRKKLAESDKEIVELIASMATKQASAIESLGAPSDRNDDVAPSTVKEAAEMADQKFVSWITS